MNLELAIFVLFISVLFALLEIQIEGQHGWAGNLPTWKFKNPLRSIINLPYVTGYHLYLNLLLFSLLQLPFFIGIPFTLKMELLIIEIFFLIILVEDFLWFVFNPKWGVKKFFTEAIPWHAKRILFLPRIYWVGFVVIYMLEQIGKTI